MQRGNDPLLQLRGMRNSEGLKSPTVRLQMSCPPATSARTSAAILRISEPMRAPAISEARPPLIEEGEAPVSRVDVAIFER
jgi:hypothetical protein